MVDEVPCWDFVGLVGAVQSGVVAHVGCRVFCEREVLEERAKIAVLSPGPV